MYVKDMYQCLDKCSNCNKAILPDEDYRFITINNIKRKIHFTCP